MGFLTISILFGLCAATASSQKVEESFESGEEAAFPWIHNRTCPDPEVRFYLFTRSNPDKQQLIHVDATSEASNLSSSFFNPGRSSVIIVHGFRSDMFLTPLFEMKNEYLQLDSYNIFFVDWYNLSSSLFYPAVVHRIAHVGACTAQLVRRIRDTGATDIHVVGFSLGAQVANYIANSLKPNYTLPRITGLDPALPLFITSNKEHKLDPSDAEFVDVFHCNGLMQGQIKRCGHVDFYFNNGVYQKGCGRDVTSCSHHRCAEYFRESIKSTVGFYGWPCSSLIQLFLGQCHSPYDNKELLLAGEHCDASLRGMFVVETNSKAPFAKGRNHLMASETVPRTTPDESESTKVPHDFLSAQQDVQRSRLEARTFLINKFGEITENR